MDNILTLEQLNEFIQAQYAQLERERDEVIAENRRIKEECNRLHGIIEAQREEMKKLDNVKG